MIKFFLRSLIGVALCSLSWQTSFANSSAVSAEEFRTQLEYMGINVQQLQSKEKLSRYELTRLLNAVECQDCVLPSQQMRNQYQLPFWSQFLQLPGKDFRDIRWEGALHQGVEYYYCVAYVGNRSYMRGYPLATSPLCGGNFCGARHVTK